MRIPPSRRHHFVFLSCNSSSWGGSEELWSAAAASLAEDGHRITVLKPNLDDAQPRIRRLRELSCRMRDLADVPFVPRRLSRALSRPSRPLFTRHRLMQLRALLTLTRPDLVVISQGVNFDGASYAEICRAKNVPYVLVAQKASDAYWPADANHERVRAAYAGAAAFYFVSEHNRRLTEEQVGMDLPHAQIVRNPFLVPWERRDDWPATERGLRLACVGRLYPAEKGQDLLIRVLARPKWRARALSVTFFGSGPNREALQRMAQHLGATNVAFAGFTDDVATVWDDHHGLLLASRAEGLPLVLVEAMLSGRVPIVTAVAGSGEVVRDGITGFLARTPSEDDVDAALELAWQRRDEWQAIGRKAADEIRTLVPPDPARTFAAMLHGVVTQPAARIAPLREPQPSES